MGIFIPSGATKLGPSNSIASHRLIKPVRDKCTCAREDSDRVHRALNHVSQCQTVATRKVTNNPKTKGNNDASMVHLTLPVSL